MGPKQKEQEGLVEYVAYNVNPNIPVPCQEGDSAETEIISEEEEGDELQLEFEDDASEGFDMTLPTGLREEERPDRMSGRRARIPGVKASQRERICRAQYPPL